MSDEPTRPAGAASLKTPGSPIRAEFHRASIVDTWALGRYLAQTLPTRSRTLLWSDARTGSSFAAIGVAAAPPEGTVDETLAWCSWAREQLRDTAPVRAPALVGAMSFDGRAPGGVWSGLPAALLWVPELVLYRDHSGESGVVLYRNRDRADAPDDSSVSFRDPLAQTRGQFVELVSRAVSDIRRGDLDKVVLARLAELDAGDGRRFDPVQTATALRARHQGATTFALLAGDRAFVGATPEMLARVESGRVETHAVAGTGSRDASAALLGSDKDRWEQALVTEGIRDSLAPLVRDLEVAAQPELLGAGAICHLVTPISGPLRDGVSLFDVARALHPTPALAGYPRQRAIRWLGEEPLCRGYYGAPLGYCAASGDGAMAVAIRSALLCGPRGYAFAGAGIVAGSDPEAEWRETELKLDTIRSGLRTSSIEVPAVPRPRRSV